MKRLVLAIAIALTGAACLSAAAQAAFGINGFDVTFTNAEGAPAIQAGSHPFAMTTSFATRLNGENVPEGWLKDFLVEQVPGLVGDTTAYPRCTTMAFLEKTKEGDPACPLGAQVGIVAISAGEPDHWSTAPVFNLTPSSGMLARLGFVVSGVPFAIDVGLSPNPPYNVIAGSRNTSQLLEVLGGRVQLWGDPASYGHDELRGVCGAEEVTLPPGEEFEFEGSGKSCPVGARSRPLLTLPTDCSEPLASSFEVFSWEGAEDFGSRLIHDAGGDPAPFGDCRSLPNPGASMSLIPATTAAQSPTGLDVSLDVYDEGLTSVDGISQSRIREAVIALPEGMTLNPSALAGLSACSEADLANETLDSAPGDGCPGGSKVGTVEVESPLLEKSLNGSLFLAGENGKKSILPSVLYIVVKDPDLGIVVKQTVEIETDPETGQPIAAVEDIPPTAVFSHFKLHLPDGASSLLVSPPRCGTYEVETEIAPWSGAAPRVAISSFQIVTGPGGGACPPIVSPPPQSDPGAGSANPAGGAKGDPRIAGPGKVKRRCSKGRHRVRRNGKTRCVKRHRANRSTHALARD